MRLPAVLVLISITAGSLPLQAVHAAETVPVTLDQSDPNVARRLRDVLARNELLTRETQGAGGHQMIEVVPENQVQLNVHRSNVAPEEARETNALGDLRGRDNIQTPHTGIHRHLWVVTAELLGLQVGTLAALSTLPADSTGWGEGGIGHMFHEWTLGPHLDTDPWYWNFVAHPVVGSEYYLLARNRNLKWWQSFLYSAAMSGFWEFVTEGYFEQASIQDLLITPIAGAVIGELRFQLKQALINPVTGKADTVLKKVLVVLLDPLDGLTRL